MSRAFKLPSGKWRVRTCIDGKRRSFTADTRRSAEAMAREAEAVDTVAEDITFGDAVLQYIDSKSSILSPSTVCGYMAIYRNYLDPIRNKRLPDIRSIDLQKCINICAASHSWKTTANVKGLITATVAVFRPDLKPTLQLPPRQKKETLIPTDEDVRAILEEAADTEIELPIMLAAFGSLRRSEICGLMPDCVFLDHITIRRALVLNPSGEFVLKECTKTAAGTRDIYLPRRVMALLLEAAGNTPPGERIFRFSPTVLYHRYKRVLELAGLPSFRFHALRHYFASFSHKLGIPDQYIMAIGGWSDISTLTKIYEHTMPDAMEETNDKISNYFEKVKGPAV